VEFCKAMAGTCDCEGFVAPPLPQAAPANPPCAHGHANPWTCADCRALTDSPPLTLVNLLWMALADARGALIEGRPTAEVAETIRQALETAKRMRDGA
jgi:hypothetical protein